MGWKDLDPQITALVVDGIEELASFAWHRVTGDSTDAKAKKAIDAIKAKAMAAAVDALAYELATQAAIAGVATALIALGPAAEGLLEAMRAAEQSPTVPVLDIEVEIIPPDGASEK